MAEHEVTRRSFLNQVSGTVGTVALGGSIRHPLLAGEAQAAPAGAGAWVREFLRRPDCDFYCEVTGAGPGLIFAHGLSGNHVSWWQQVPYFSDRYTCVTFAHRGFTPSKEALGGPGPAAFVDDLAAFIDHLKLPDVCLVAQSMGGLTCLGYALREPARVRALVMASTTGGVDFRSIKHPEIERLPLLAERASRTRADLSKQGINAAAGARMAREQPALHFLYQEIQDLTPQPYRQAVSTKLTGGSRHSPDAVARLRMPVLFVIGDEDVVGVPGASVAIASLISGARVEHVPDAGHSVYFERAQTFNRLVDAFLTSAMAVPPRKA